MQEQLLQTKLVSRVEGPVKSDRTISEVPFVGYRIDRGGKGDLVQLILSPSDDFSLIAKAGNVLQGLDRMAGRGYAASALFGLAGEGSSAQAAGGVLCLMPCHWAMYASAIAKFTPLAAYFAAKPSCCHADPDPKVQALAYALDTVFYSTVAGLGAGVVRRLLRRRDAEATRDSIRDVLGANGELPSLQDARVWTPDFYDKIVESGDRWGVPKMQEALAKAEYVRTGDSYTGKAAALVKRGVRRAMLAVGDTEYRANGRELASAYQALEALCVVLAKDARQEEHPTLKMLERAYARERVGAASSFNPVNLGRKLIAYGKGFGENACWYRQDVSAK